MRTWLGLVFVCACTQDFGQFDPAAVDGSAETGPEGGASDVAAEGFSCTESGAVTFGGHCYFLDIGQNPFAAASLGCMAVGAHLVTITSSAEQAAVAPLGAGTERWIGLQSSSGATDANYVWITGEPRNGYSAWSNGEPNGSGQCAAMLPASNWADEACSQPFASICERE